MIYLNLKGLSSRNRHQNEQFSKRDSSFILTFDNLNRVYELIINKNVKLGKKEKKELVYASYYMTADLINDANPNPFCKKCIELLYESRVSLSKSIQLSNFSPDTRCGRFQY